LSGRVPGVQPSIRTYNAILAGHSKFGRLHEISTVLEAMTADGVSRDSYTFSLLVRAYSSAADMRKAFGIRLTASVWTRVLSLSTYLDADSAYINYRADLYKEFKAAGFPLRHDLCNHLLNGLRQQGAPRRLFFIVVVV
jgi:pentatricopeptide repeat protein